MEEELGHVPLPYRRWVHVLGACAVVTGVAGGVDRSKHTLVIGSKGEAVVQAGICEKNPDPKVGLEHSARHSYLGDSAVRVLYPFVVSIRGNGGGCLPFPVLTKGGKGPANPSTVSGYMRADYEARQ